jgi:hypothetical protein
MTHLDTETSGEPASAEAFVEKVWDCANNHITCTQLESIP